MGACRPAVLAIGIPCRADEPGLEGTLESLFIACQHPELPPELVVEMVICINSLRRGRECLPLTSVRNFCARHSVPVEEVWIELVAELSAEVSDGPSPLPPLRKCRSKATPRPPRGRPTGPPLPRCTVLLTERKGKPLAWNTLWRWARGEMILFCDADVRVEKEAVFHLYARLQRDSHLRLVAAREVPVLEEGGTLWSRMGAIPYRFDFGNAGGRLLLIRKDALTDRMPEDLLLEDAWLTVAVGRRRVAKEPRARVFFLPPATWCDYFAERVRTEGGKLQIRRAHMSLLAEGPIAQYSWSQFWQEILLREYPLVFLALGLRGLARLWAWMALTRQDFYSLYRPFSSTKDWRPLQR